MKKLTLALAGNPNVGKSVVFNYFTGMSQHVGNWPGKTVEKAQGKLVFQDYEIEIVDLPGVYSISPDSPEEAVFKEYIDNAKPDVIMDIVDASVLERNLFLTFQLLSFGIPLVIALNMVDIAERKGLAVDSKKLEAELGMPTVETVAVHGRGLDEVLRKAIRIKERRVKSKAPHHPARAAEIYREISAVVRKVQKSTPAKGLPLEERIDSIALHKFYGYPVFFLVVAVLFYSVFSFGGWLSGIFYSFFGQIEAVLAATSWGSALSHPLWKGIFEGVVAAFVVALPYVLPFYVVFAILEDSGYVARMAFLMDGFMHTIGLHGKAFIPLFIGYGCTVPACIGCRIIGSERERFQTAFLSTLVPCSARSVIILGLAGAYLGWQWALAIYLFNIVVVLLLGKATSRLLPGEQASFIMEMPSYKMPQLKNVAVRAFQHVKSYLAIAFPVIIVMSFFISLLDFAGMFGPIEKLLAPLTSGWLGLPAAVGIALIAGILRKELALVMLATIFGTTDFASVFSPMQMVVFTIVMLFYIPCSATIAALVKEFGWRKAAAITAFEIALALVLGGIVLRTVPWLGLLA